jgi:hypothetical protein
MAVLLLAGVAHAEPGQAPRQIIVIPKTYVSPGASGSIGGYQQYEQRQWINGRPLPDLNRRESIQSGDYQFQQRGGIRQSTEYPGGLRIERYPGDGGFQRYDSR